jgi:hypothetical protein
LIRVAHNGRFQSPVEAFQESVSCGVVGGCPREFNATLPGEGLEKLKFELKTLVSGDGLGATEAGYPTG